MEIKLKALYDYKATDSTQLSIKKGEVLTLVEKTNDNWWNASNHTQIGYVPSNYVEEMKPTVVKSSVSPDMRRMVLKTKEGELNKSSSTPQHLFAMKGHKKSRSLITLDTSKTSEKDKKGKSKGNEKEEKKAST